MATEQEPRSFDLARADELPYRRARNLNAVHRHALDRSRGKAEPGTQLDQRGDVAPRPATEDEALAGDDVARRQSARQHAITELLRRHVGDGAIEPGDRHDFDAELGDERGALGYRGEQQRGLARPQHVVGMGVKGEGGGE